MHFKPHASPELRFRRQGQRPEVLKGRSGGSPGRGNEGNPSRDPRWPCWTKVSLLPHPSSLATNFQMDPRLRVKRDALKHPQAMQKANWLPPSVRLLEKAVAA